MKAKATLTVGLAVVILFWQSSALFAEELPAKTGDGAGKAKNLIPPADLAGYVPVLKKESPEQDAREVWKIEDGQLHLTGKGWGYLRSEKTYADYHLTLEYRWGEFTHPKRGSRARDAGLFVHALPPDRAYDEAWLSSFEVQMVEGRAGDFIVIAAIDPANNSKAPHRLKSRAAEIVVTGEPYDYVFTPGAELRELPPRRLQRVRIFRDPHDLDWEDEKGYRSPDRLENPAGEWNTLEVVAKGDTLEVKLNGRTVNKTSEVRPTSGHLCLQSEMAECWIRKWQLVHLDSSE